MVKINIEIDMELSRYNPVIDTIVREYLQKLDVVLERHGVDAMVDYYVTSEESPSQTHLEGL